MKTDQRLFRIAGWTAVIAAVITFFTIITFAIGISVGWERVGQANDIAAALMALLHLPILLAVDKSVRPPSRVQLVIGLLAALVVAVVQILFVAGVVEFAFTTVPAALGSGILALIYMAYNWQARQAQALPNGLTLVGLIANAGGALASFASLLRPDHPLVWVGGTLYLLNVVWLFWLGRLWLSGKGSMAA